MVIYPYVVIGRTVPTDRDPAPKIFKAKVYAANDVVAKSRFFKYMRVNREANRAKKSTIQILKCQKKGQEYAGRAKTFGFCLNYQSRTHRVGMYKEVRATTEVEAANKLVADMAGRHRADASSIKITSVKEVSKGQIRRLINKGLTDELISFRYPYAVVPKPKELKTRFATRSSIQTRNLKY
jgi:large subunit ribosomal protein L18Ae